LYKRLLFANDFALKLGEVVSHVPENTVTNKMSLPAEPTKTTSARIRTQAEQFQSQILLQLLISIFLISTSIVFVLWYFY